MLRERNLTVSRQCRLSFFGVVCIQPGSAESIQVTSRGTAGSADITVTAPGGTSRVVPADEFTYNANPAIFSVTPNNGPGTVVNIMGHAFDNSSTVSFGGVAATNVTYTPRCAANICIDGLTVTVPPGQVLTQYPSGGQVDITVTTAEQERQTFHPRAWIPIILSRPRSLPAFHRAPAFRDNGKHHRD